MIYVIGYCTHYVRLNKYLLQILYARVDGPYALLLYKTYKSLKHAVVYMAAKETLLKCEPIKVTVMSLDLDGDVGIVPREVVADALLPPAQVRQREGRHFAAKYDVISCIVLQVSQWKMCGADGSTGSKMHNCS